MRTEKTMTLTKPLMTLMTKSRAAKQTFTVFTMLGLAGLIGLSGCASNMTKKECESTDYYQMGLEDGRDGKTADHYNKVAEQCRTQGVNPPDSKYTYGRQVGLAQYCSDSRATRDAKNGNEGSICLKEKVPPYEEAYSRALDREKKQKADALRDLQNAQSKLDQKQKNLQGDLNKIDQQEKVVPTTN